MENLIDIKKEYNSLDKLCEYLERVSTLDCSKEYDMWEMRTDDNGQMEQCLVLKKSGMHALKLYFIKDNTIKINHIIPSKMMHAYFGKSQKRYRNILEIVVGKIKDIILAGPQQKAFEELELIVKQAGV